MLSEVSFAAGFFAELVGDLAGAIFGRLVWGAALAITPISSMLIIVSKNERKGTGRLRQTFINNRYEYFIPQDYLKKLSKLNQLVNRCWSL